MLEPSSKELDESIEELTSYLNRLKKEVTTMSQKLRLPSNEINSILSSHKEINQIEKIIQKLSNQKKCKLPTKANKNV